MNFIFVPVTITALIYFIENFIGEQYLLTQFITYSPQVWTLILPLIYLTLAIKAKHKVGILVNIGLILFICSAFFGYNVPFTTNNEKADLSVISYNNKPLEINNEIINNKLKHTIDGNNIFISKIKENNTTIDIYNVVYNGNYYQSRKDFATKLIEYVNNKSEYAIISGDMNFPPRGLNYIKLTDDYNDSFTAFKGFGYTNNLNRTKYIFCTKNITPISYTTNKNYIKANFHIEK